MKTLALFLLSIASVSSLIAQTTGSKTGAKAGQQASASKITRESVEKDLDAMNEYLVKFRGKYYGGLLVENDKLTCRYRDGEVTRLAVNQVASVTYSAKEGWVKLMCKEGRPCAHNIEADTWKPYVIFKTLDKTKDPAHLYKLMNTFFIHFKVYDAELKRSSNPAYSSPDPEIRELQRQILEINDQLRVFRRDEYKGLVVKGDSMIFDDGYLLKTRALVRDLDEVKYDAEKKHVYISCVGGKNCAVDFKNSKNVSRIEFPKMPDMKARELKGLLTPFIPLLKKKMAEVSQQPRKQQNVQKQQKVKKSDDDDILDAFFGD